MPPSSHGRIIEMTRHVDTRVNGKTYPVEHIQEDKHGYFMKILGLIKFRTSAIQYRGRYVQDLHVQRLFFL